MALLMGCGSSSAEAPAAKRPAPESSEGPEPEETTEANPGTNAGATEGKSSSDAAKASHDEASASEASSEEDDNKQRNVLYRVTGNTVVVEVEGVKFEPKVTAIQKKGGWGVKVSVKATSTDGHMHRLLSPENGPLAFAAKIRKEGGGDETHADERKGEDEAFVPPDDSTDFSREYPGAKEAPVAKGQTLELQVGLWGLGIDANRRRPIRKLFIVKMETGNKTPLPKITPPE